MKEDVGTMYPKENLGTVRPAWVEVTMIPEREVAAAHQSAMAALSRTIQPIFVGGGVPLPGTLTISPNY